MSFIISIGNNRTIDAIYACSIVILKLMKWCKIKTYCKVNTLEEIKYKDHVLTGNGLFKKFKFHLANGLLKISYRAYSKPDQSTSSQ